MRFLLFQLLLTVTVAAAVVLPLPAQNELPPAPIHEGSVHWGEIERYIAKNKTTDHLSKTDFSCSNSGINPDFYGCYRGYCWAYCGDTIVTTDWCYTTATGNSGDNNYVTCHANSDCCGDWSCGGTCG